MILKLLLLYSLFILSASQVGSKVGKSENRWYGAKPSSSLTYCTRSSVRCRVDRRPECCYHPVCASRQPKRCQWLTYLGGSVEPLTTAGLADVLKTEPSVNEDLVEISTLGTSTSGLSWCLPRCDVRKTPACCYNPDCMARRYKDCIWMDFLREGNMRNQSGNLRGISDTDSETSVTICKNGSNETLSVEQLETEVLDANCSFIAYNDSTPSCKELKPHCNPQRSSPATWACWNLNWCPKKIGNNHWKLKWRPKRFGKCCFHPDYKNNADQCSWVRSL